MNNSNRFLEISLKQQLALCEIGKDLIEIDTKIDESYNNHELSSGNSNLPNMLIKILNFFKAPIIN